jgi:hypothetical protein
MAAVASERGGGGGKARVSQSIPDNMIKTIQNIREITGKQHSDDEIFVVLNECSMDPNETAQKLLYLGIFTSLAIYVFFICIRVFAALGVFLCIRVLCMRVFLGLGWFFLGFFLLVGGVFWFLGYMLKVVFGG